MLISGENYEIIKIGCCFVKSFIEDVAKTNSIKNSAASGGDFFLLNQNQLEQELTQAKFNPEVLQKIQTAENQNNWYVYKNILTTRLQQSG